MMNNTVHAVDIPGYRVHISICQHTPILLPDVISVLMAGKEVWCTDCHSGIQANKNGVTVKRSL